MKQQKRQQTCWFCQVLFAVEQPWGWRTGLRSTRAETSSQSLEEHSPARRRRRRPDSSTYIGGGEEKREEPFYTNDLFNPPPVPRDRGEKCPLSRGSIMRHFSTQNEQDLFLLLIFPSRTHRHKTSALKSFHSAALAHLWFGAVATQCSDMSTMRTNTGSLGWCIVLLMKRSSCTGKTTGIKWKDRARKRVCHSWRKVQN